MTENPTTEDIAPDAVDSEPLATEAYLRLKSMWQGLPARRKKRRTTTPVGSEPFTPGRDPVGIGDALGVITTEFGWTKTLAQAEVITAWPEIVGAETAANTTIEQFTDGVLTVRCSSTAWATQLSFMAADVRTRVIAAHPDAGVEKITFIGPNAPSWKRGPKSVPGRGVRDTYG